MNADNDLPLRRDDPLSLLVAEDLDRLSQAELASRITDLNGEIGLCEAKLSFARDHKASADALFRKT